MRNSTLFILSVFASFLLLYGCSDSPTDGSSETGTLVVRLTDAPGDYEAVNITFSEVSAHIDGEWIVVRDDTTTVNLLEWNNGNSLVLGTADVPAGQYTQIRLKIVAAEVEIDGEAFSMFVPSGAQTGLKLLTDFTVPSGSTFELMIDFDANRSVVTTGPPNNPMGYILKPTVRVEPVALTGSISGTVSNPESRPLAYALADGDTVTSSAIDISSGQFMLAFLPADMYTVSIVDTAGATFQQDSVEVVAGTDADLGNILLQ